jgi:hypothetical protein
MASPVTTHPARGDDDVVSAPAATTTTAWAPAEKVDVPYMATESIMPESRGHPPSIKTRFTSAYSAVAWPKRLGINLGMANPPRLQAFGWNTGTRPEVTPVPTSSICNILSLEEAKHFADVYFKEVHPYFGILDPEMFGERCDDFWASARQGTDFEACVCGVVALGSYFSVSPPAPPSPVEAQVVEQGRILLDLSFAHPPVMISVKHVVAWILRALYLRLTTRPHVSWIASCNAVHIAEAIGLHREISEFQLKSDMPRQITQMEVDHRRRTFWVATALNQFFASEYGRTKVQIDLIGCQPLSATAQPGDMTAQTVAILQSAPGQALLGRPVELLGSLAKAMALPVKSPFLALVRADVCFCIYRMLSSTNSRFPAEQIPSFLNIIRVALDGVVFLGTLKESWWNVVSTPLQCVGVLLSLGTTESLSMIPSALEALKSITAIYDSHLSREALSTGYALVQAAREQRSKQLESLDRGLDVVGEVSQSASSIITTPGDEFQWPMDNDLGFSDFLDLSSYYNLTDRALAGPAP